MKCYLRTCNEEATDPLPSSDGMKRWFCANHYRLTILKLLKWAEGESTEKRRRNAIRWLDEHPEFT
jgi:hypothetical protein